MTEEANLRIMKDAYEAFARGDIEAVLAMEHPQVDMEIAGPKDIPWAGRYRGHEGARQYFGAIDRDAEFDAFEPRTFMAQGDKVVVLGYEKVRSKRTSRTYENHWVHEFTLADGKIVTFREYCDTATVAAAFRDEAAV